MTDSKTIETVALNFERICRTCKSDEGEMYDVFTNTFDTNPSSPRIDEMLMACTSLQITRDDGLPSLICLQCVNSLEVCYDFKDLCERSDAELREIAETHRNNDKAQELQEKVTEIEDMIDFSGMRNPASPKTQVEDMIPAVPPDQKCDFKELLKNNEMTLTCEHCFKAFTTMDALECHKRSHASCPDKRKLYDKSYSRFNHLQQNKLMQGKKIVYICKICNKILTRYEQRKRHLVIHLKEKPFSCEKCSRRFNRAEHLTSHVKICKGKGLHICHICNRGFSRAGRLKVHKQKHNTIPPLRTLDNLDNIEEHYIEVDQNGDVIDDVGNNDDDGDDNDDNDGNLDEPLMDISSNDPKQKEESQEEETMELKLKEEIKMEKPDTPPQESQVVEYDENVSDSDHSEYTPTKVQSKTKRGRGRPRIKEVRPGRPPKSAKVVTKKGKVEAEDGNFRCPICSEEFFKASLLEKHAKNHAGAKVFGCSTCNKTFSRSSHLKRHEYLHLEIREYMCSLCPKAFGRRDHLVQHLKLHSRSEEFTCDICNCPFTRAYHLEKHKQRKHGNRVRVKSEKKYKCEECQKSFTTVKYRDIHMKLHTGGNKFQCMTCDEICVSKSHLTEHIKFHSDSSKEFLCSEQESIETFILGAVTE